MFKISMILSDEPTSESFMLLICVVIVSILLTYCRLRFSISSSFFVISACSSLSTSFLKTGSQIEEGCDALCEYAYRTSVSILTANCLIVSFGSLRISLHKIL